MLNRLQQILQRDPPGLRLECSLKTVGNPTSWHWTTTSWQSLATGCTCKRFWWYGGSFVVLHDFTLFDVVWHGVKEQLQSRNWDTGHGFSARSAALSKTLKPHWWSSCVASLYCYSSYSSTLIKQVAGISVVICYFLTRSFSRWDAFPQIRTQSIRSKLSGKHQVLTSTQAIKVQFSLIP